MLRCLKNKCLYCGNIVFIGVELFVGEITPMCKKHYDEYKRKKKIEQATEAGETTKARDRD